MQTPHIDAVTKIHLQQIIEHQNGFIFTFSKLANGKFIHTFCEGKLLKKMNLKIDQVIGYELKDFLPEDKADAKHKMYEKAWNGEIVTYEGSVFGITYLASLSPVIEDGQVVQVIGTCVDINDRKKKEHRLETSEQHFKSLFTYNSDPVFSLDENGYFTSVNHAAKEITGHTEEQMKKRTFLPYITPDYQLDTLHNFQRVMRGESLTFRGAITNEKNERKELKITAVPIVINGEITGVYGIARDITKQEEYRKALELSEERYRILVEYSPIAIAVLVNDKLKFVNASYLELLHSDAEMELVNQSIWERVVPKHHERVSTQFEAILNSEIPSVVMDSQFVRTDGKLIDVEMTAMPIDFEGDRAVLLLVSNISERKRVEKEVERINRQNELVLNTAGDGILSLSTNLLINFVNDAVLHLLGYTREDLLGKPVSSLFDIHAAKHKDSFLSKLDQSMKDQTVYQVREQLISRKDADPILSDITITPITEDNVQKGSVLVIKDITQQKKLDEMMIRSDKLSVLGELAAGIAHEIRNPLTSLKGFIQLFHSIIDDRYTDYCDIMLEELERVNGIVGEFLMLSRPQPTNMSAENPVLLIKEVVSFLYSEAIMNNVNIHEDFVVEDVHIKGERNQLKQVFINLLKNAIESMDSGGNVFINVEKKNENELQIRFQDEGCGIDENRIGTLGQPFYTTKERGTGLGLMICYKIIENHNGKITFQSKVGVGTIAEITLPIMSNGEIGSSGV